MNEFEIIFESDNIKYIKLSEKLIDDYLVMVNDREISCKIRPEYREFSYEEEKSWVEEKRKENAICYSMIEKTTNEFIGNIEIMNIKDNIGEIGICITSKKQNNHYGIEAMKKIIEYGLKELKLDGLELNVYKTNSRAIHCYEKVGFIKKGKGSHPQEIHMIYSPTNDK